MTTLVIAEHDNASIKGATLNTVTAAVACGGDVHVLIAGQNALEPLAALDPPVGLQPRLLALEQVEVERTGQGPVDAGRRNLQHIVAGDGVGGVEHL